MRDKFIILKNTYKIIIVIIYCFHLVGIFEFNYLNLLLLLCLADLYLLTSHKFWLDFINLMMNDKHVRILVFLLSDPIMWPSLPQLTKLL